jgi:hypothetical protein
VTPAVAVIQAAGEVSASDGGGIALVGMATVFVGLLVLSLSLPLLRRTSEERGKAGQTEGEDGDGRAPRLSEQEKAAIAAAIHVHLNSLDQLERMKLTWEMYERPYSPWRLAGRAEALEARGALTFRLGSR